MTESFRDFLDKRKRTAVAIFHRFRLEVSGGLRHALFVEGFEDQAFYGRFLPVGHFDRGCVRMTFGKINMDRIVALFYAESLNERCDARFIRDADFDEFLGTLPVGDHVIVLDRYSVENFIFTPDSFQAMLEMRFGVSPDEFNIEACIGRYEQGVQEIFLHLAPLFGAAFAAIEDGNSLDLNALDIRGIASIYFKSGNLRPLEDADYDRCKIGAEYRTADALVRGRDFVTRNPFLWMRGHYLSLVSSAFLQRTHDLICAQKKSGQLHTLNPNLSTDFSSTALTERMSAYCSTPTPVQCLAT